MEKTLNRTKNYYDGISKGYKQLYHEEQILKISKLKKYIPKNQTILDLGSGDGVLNQFIENNSNFISLDLSFNMLKNNNNDGNKIQASITNIPLKDNSIKNIICLTAIQDIENTQLAIKEINRILESKGTLIISFLKNSQKKENIINELNKYFKIKHQIEELKDLILIYERLE